MIEEVKGDRLTRPEAFRQPRADSHMALRLAPSIRYQCILLGASNPTSTRGMSGNVTGEQHNLILTRKPCARTHYGGNMMAYCVLKPVFRQAAQDFSLEDANQRVKNYFMSSNCCSIIKIHSTYRRDHVVRQDICWPCVCSQWICCSDF